MRLELCFFISCYILLIVLYCFTKVNINIPEITQDRVALLVVCVVVTFTLILYRVLNTDLKAGENNEAD